MNQFNISFGMDTNGNKTVKVMTEKGGFSLQTNGKMSITHRMSSPYNDELLDAKKEIIDYVSKYGTKGQKLLLNLNLNLKMRTKTLKPNQDESTLKLLSMLPSFHKSGSILGMKQKYYGKDALLVRHGNYIYNCTGEPTIYHHCAD